MTDAVTAAPPAKAAPAASTSTASPPAGAASQPGGGGYGTEFEELDALAAAPEKKDPPAKAEPEKKDPPAAPDPEKKVEPAAKVDDKPPAKAQELRTAYETSKKRVADLERELSEAKSGKGRVDDGEFTKVKETLAQKEKRLAEMETEMRFTNYEKSDDYRETWQAPTERAFKSAYADLAELRVSEDGDMRQATPDDFHSLINMPLQEATDKAKEMFGNASTEVMAHRRKIIELNRGRREALDKYRKEGSERERQQSEHAKKQQETLQGIWDGTNKSISEKYPQWFAPSEKDADGKAKDPEGDKLLQAGYEFADAAFYGIGKEQPEKLAQIQAIVRSRSAAFGKVAHQLKIAEARNAELLKELEAFKKSGPGGEDTAGASRSGELSANDELDQLARGR